MEIFNVCNISTLSAEWSIINLSIRLETYASFA